MLLIYLGPYRQSTESRQSYRHVAPCNDFTTLYAVLFTDRTVVIRSCILHGPFYRATLCVARS